MTEKRNTQPTEITAQGYFAVIPDWVADLPISRAALCVYISLRRYADNTTGECWPSRRTLATRSQISVDTLDRAIRELAAHDAISITKRKNDKGEWTSSLYTVMTLPKGVAANIPLPSRKYPTRGSRKSPIGTISSINDIHEHISVSDFDRLWAIYPRKIGKAAARKAFDRVTRSTGTPPIGDLCTAVEQYASQISELRYCLHLATWLHGERWADGIQAVTVAAARLEPRIDSAMSAGASHRLSGMSEQTLIDSLAHRPADEQAAALEQYRR